MRGKLEAARLQPSVRRSATQEAAGGEEKPEGQGQAPRNCDLEVRDVRAGHHVRHAHLVQILQVSVYPDTASPSQW
jgi:hypothetical protein